MQKKVSVIIPVYNSEASLRRCLDSVCLQTYKNIEIICINDGSLDDSGRILDEFACSDNRLKIIHQSNSGAASARNVGLDIVSGEYIVMVDADDYIHQSMIEKMINIAERTNCDLVLSGMLHNGGKKKNTVSLTNLREGLQRVNPRSFFRDFAPGPVAKMYSTDIIRQFNIRFPYGIAMGEDAVFVARYMYHSETLFVIKEPLYIHDSSDVASATSRFASGKHLLSVYAQTLALPGIIYDSFVSSGAGKQPLHKWVPCLLNMQLIENDWVMYCAPKRNEVQGELKKIAREHYKKLAGKLSWCERIYICVSRIPTLFRGKLMRLAGKVKRMIFPK